MMRRIGYVVVAINVGLLLAGCALQQSGPRPLLGSTPEWLEANPAARGAHSVAAAQFVRAEGTRFKLGDEPFYAPGTNNYYLLTYASDRDTRRHVDEVLEDAAAMGLKVIRTWAFNDGANEWNAIQTAPGKYVERVFRGLDYVIYKAGKQGLRVILPFVNNWNDYGGMCRYVAWDVKYGTDPNEVAKEHNKFYTDSDTRRWYKDFVRAVINRRNTYTGVLYRDDPTIFAWELANEPEVKGDTSGNILQAWIEEMAPYVKSLDPNHMLTVGIAGFYSGQPGNSMYDGSTGTDFIRNHQVEGIDFATVHIYPAQWGLDYDASLAWYRQHLEDARDILHMPLLLKEFGLEVTKTVSRAQRNKLYQGLLDLAEQMDAPGWNFWMLAHNNYRYGNYNVVYPTHTSTVAIICEAAAAMNRRSRVAGGDGGTELSGLLGDSGAPTTVAAGARLSGTVTVAVSNDGEPAPLTPARPGKAPSAEAE